MTGTVTRHVSATLEVQLSGPERLEPQLGPPDLPGLEVDERLAVVLDGAGAAVVGDHGDHGNRVHVLEGASDTLMAGAGVCRDDAHLVIALLRALDVPARLVAVYAPAATRWTSTPSPRWRSREVAGRRRDLPDPASVAAADLHGRDAADTAS